MTETQRQEVKAFRLAALKFTKKATRSRATALRTLVNAGLITEQGTLRKQYR